MLLLLKKIIEEAGFDVTEDGEQFYAYQITDDDWIPKIVPTETGDYFHCVVKAGKYRLHSVHMVTLLIHSKTGGIYAIHQIWEGEYLDLDGLLLFADSIYSKGAIERTIARLRSFSFEPGILPVPLIETFPQNLAHATQIVTGKQQ